MTHQFGPWSEWAYSQSGVQERERWCTQCPDHAEYQFRLRPGR